MGWNDYASLAQQKQQFSIPLLQTTTCAFTLESSLEQLTVLLSTPAAQSFMVPALSLRPPPIYTGEERTTHPFFHPGMVYVTLKNKWTAELREQFDDCLDHAVLEVAAYEPHTTQYGVDGGEVATNFHHLATLFPVLSEATNSIADRFNDASTVFFRKRGDLFAQNLEQLSVFYQSVAYRWQALSTMCEQHYSSLQIPADTVARPLADALRARIGLKVVSESG
jgi:hypothetical protein